MYYLELNILLILHCSCLHSPLLSSWVSPLSLCFRDSDVNHNMFQEKSVQPLDGGQPCVKHVPHVMHCDMLAFRLSARAQTHFIRHSLQIFCFKKVKKAPQGFMQQNTWFKHANFYWFLHFALLPHSLWKHSMSTCIRNDFSVAVSSLAGWFVPISSATAADNKKT